MIRILLIYILPFLFPGAIYFLWRHLRRGGEQEDGQERKDPWFWLILAGLALMSLALAYTAMTGDKITDGTYRPDRYEEGRIVPGGIKSSP